MRKLIIFALLSFNFAEMAAALPQAPTDKRWKALDTADIDTLSKKMTVVNDPMEQFVKVTSEPIYKQSPPLLSLMVGNGPSDSFLRAYIDKKTGKTVYQFYTSTVYVGPYESFRRANYLSADGPVPTEITEIENDLVKCDARSCQHSLVLSAAIPRNVLDWAASRDGSVGSNLWFVRFASVRQSADRGMHPKEISAFLARTDAEIARLAQ